ncbi:porin family protein [Myroides odoratus]
MKKLFILLFVLFTSANVSAQWMFGKNPIRNKPDWDKQRVHYGYYLGTNFLNFDFNYDKQYYDKIKSLSSEYGSDNTEIQVTTNMGFSVGLVGNLRIMEYLDLRFEPGLIYSKRDLKFPRAFIMDYYIKNKPLETIPTMQELANSSTKSISSTLIHLPLLLKFSAMRTGNIRPYVLGGFSADLNLSSNHKSDDDNYEGVWRMKQWTTNYELGVGIDIYFEYFKFSPSIRGVFGLGDELIRDKNPDSPWTGHITSMKTRGVFLNFTVH